MRLTLHTDYAMRVLLHLAAHTEGLSSIAEIATVYAISRNHLMKVVQNLSRAGLVTAVRGRCGGLRLGRPADQITVGDVVRETEDGFTLVDCSQCLIAGVCELPPVLNEATRAFLTVLDSHTVADLLKRRQTQLRLLDAKPNTVALRSRPHGAHRRAPDAPVATSNPAEPRQRLGDPSPPSRKGNRHAQIP